MAVRRECQHCHVVFEAERRNARFCTDAHYRRGDRRRKAGVPVDAYAAGARRGRVKLGMLTKRERELQAAFAKGRRHEREHLELHLELRNLVVVTRDVVTAMKGAR